MIVFTINGVLRDPQTESFIPAGIALLHALGERVSVGVIAGDDVKESVLRHWLTVNNVEAQYLVLPRELDSDDEGALRVEQLNRLRQSGTIDLLVEADPFVAAAVLREGIPTMLFCTPFYARPEHLPDERLLPTAWSVLLSEVDRQQSIKASDPRIVAESV